jgi:hypothetical protein
MDRTHSLAFSYVAELPSQILAERQCKGGEKSAHPTAISQPLHHAHPLQIRRDKLSRRLPPPELSKWSSSRGISSLAESGCMAPILLQWLGLILPIYLVWVLYMIDTV